MTEPVCIAWVERLVGAVPSLKMLYVEHRNDYDELLPHVFLGDVTRYVIQAFSNVSGVDSCPSFYGETVRILKFIEEAEASKDPAMIELISVSFLENVDWEERTSQALRTFLGPKLRGELVRREEE